jgi:hypothetical protein
LFNDACPSPCLCVTPFAPDSNGVKALFAIFDPSVNTVISNSHLELFIWLGWLSLIVIGDLNLVHRQFCWIFGLFLPSIESTSTIAVIGDANHSSGSQLRVNHWLFEWRSCWVASRGCQSSLSVLDQARADMSIDWSFSDRRNRNHHCKNRMMSLLKLLKIFSL